MRREERLPLPQEVGDAITGRPAQPYRCEMHRAARLEQGRR
jgi:hypothetical protein